MKQNQDKLSKLRNAFTLDAKLIAKILGTTIWNVQSKMSNRPCYKFKDEEIEKLENYLISQAEELKAQRGNVTQTQLLDVLKETVKNNKIRGYGEFVDTVKAQELISKIEKKTYQ